MKEEFICGHCKRTGGRTHFTGESFKKTFRVGDTIIGFSTKKEMTITAIGTTRFLYLDDRKKERVARFNTSLWRKK